MANENDWKRGDVFAFPLTVLSPAGERDLGVFGVGKILSYADGKWFVAALEGFPSSADSVNCAAPLMNHTRIESLPARSGLFLFSGGETPDDWSCVGHSPLDDAQLGLATLYEIWKDRSRPMFETQTAYQKLSSVSEGLGSLPMVLAIEWRFRFETNQILSELEARKSRTKPVEPKPTWEAISKTEFVLDNGEFQAHVANAYSDLIGGLSSKSRSKTAKKKLELFFSQVFKHRLSGEYRDEVANIAAGFGLYFGLPENEVFSLAEEANG